MLRGAGFQVGGAGLVLVYLHGDLFHQGFKFRPGVGAGGGVIHIQPGGPAGHVLCPTGHVNVGSGLGSIVGPGHGQLVLAVVNGVEYLAHPVVGLGDVGAVEPVNPDPGGGHDHQGQQPKKKLIPQRNGRLWGFAGMDILGTVGAEDGVLRQGRAAMGAVALQCRSFLSVSI